MSSESLRSKVHQLIVGPEKKLDRVGRFSETIQGLLGDAEELFVAEEFSSGLSSGRYRYQMWCCPEEGGAFVTVVYDLGRQKEQVDFERKHGVDSAGLPFSFHQVVAIYRA